MPLSIVTFPHTVLTQPTRKVARITNEVSRLIEAMIATMRRHPRCVGLAAPQVGSDWRIAVMDASHHPRVGSTHGLLVLVNPVVELAPEASIQREGCLSVPDFTANVRRATRVRLTAQDRSGSVYQRSLEGFEAIVAQHEVDHLNGQLFLDRVVNLATDVFRRKAYG